MKYIVTKPFASFKEGQVIEFKKGVPLAAQSHVKPYAGESKQFAVNPAELKAEAVAEYKESDEFKSLLKSQDDDEMEQLHRLHKDIVGTEAHHKSGAKKIADAILGALGPVED